MENDKVITEKSNYDELLKIKEKYISEIHKKSISVNFYTSRIGRVSTFNMEIGSDIPEEIKNEFEKIKQNIKGDIVNINTCIRDIDRKTEEYRKEEKNLKYNNEELYRQIMDFNRNIRNLPWYVTLFYTVKQYKFINKMI
jgi:predicted RNase H-like nuclease (RuvC/YqgF family)